jgi:hypothetical protein
MVRGRGARLKSAGLRQMYQVEESVRQRTNIDAKLMEYVGRAMAAGRG